MTVAAARWADADLWRSALVPDMKRIAAPMGGGLSRVLLMTARLP